MAIQTRKINAMRNETTGEIGCAHYIGQTKTGKLLYAPASGWEPVAQLGDGTYQPSTGLRRNCDGYYVVAPWRDDD